MSAGAPLRPSTEARPVPRWVVVAALLALVTPYFLGLGAPPLFDANEPLYAEPPREALETGDWLSPPWNYRPWFVRPPLSTWATMLGYAALGVGEAGARIAGAVAAALTLLAVYGIAAAQHGRRLGLLAAAVVAATPRIWFFARQLPGDTWLTLALVTGFFGALPTLRGDARPGRLVLGHAAVAIGVLAKGPVILGLYAVPLVVAARLGLPRVPLRRLRPGTLAVLTLLLAGPWFAYMAQRHGLPYVRDFFGWHHVRRAVSVDVGSRSVLYPLTVLVGEGQPWVLAAPFAAIAAFQRRRRDPATLLVWAAALFPLVFFSIPLGKRSVYLLPGYPMLALAVTPWLAEAARGLHRRAVLAMGAVGAVAAAVGVVFLLLARRHVPDDLARASTVFLIGLPVAGAVALVSGLRGAGRGLVGVFAGAPIAALLAAAALLPVLGRYMPVPRLAATLVRHASPGDAAVVYGVSVHSLMFYARRPTVRARNPAELLAALPPGGHAYAIGEAHALAEVPRHAPLLLTELDRGPWFRFHFGRNVLGHGPSTRELVLVRVERSPAGAGGGGREGADADRR